MILDSFPLDDDDVLSRSMGASGTDLHLSPKAREFIDFDIECKCVDKVRLWESWDQACANGENALLLIKKSRREPLAVLSLEKFLELLKELK
jgi:hypothetical protein